MLQYLHVCIFVVVGGSGDGGVGGGGGGGTIIISLSIRYHVTKKTDGVLLGGASPFPSVTWHFFAATATRISRPIYREVR